VNKYFLGTYEPTLLSSGQIALPSKIRRVVPGDELILSIGFDNCVFGYSMDGWDKVVDEAVVQPAHTPEGRLLRRQIFASAEEVKMDSQGRFVIPSNLRQYAQISGDVMVIGAGDHFEIWDKGLWEKQKESVLANG